MNKDYLNLSINGMKIVPSIEIENFSKYKKGQQFLIVNEYKDEDSEMPYNNIQIAFLMDIFLNAVYTINGVDNNVAIDFEDIPTGKNDEYEDEIIEHNFNYAGYNSKEFERTFLMLDKEKNIKIELSRFYEEDIDFDKTDNLGSKSQEIDKLIIFKDIARTCTYINTKRVVDFEKHKVEFYLLCKIDDNYICHYIYNSIDTSKYGWYIHEETYLVNQEFTKFSNIAFIEKDNIINKLATIESINKKYSFDEFIQIYKGNTFDIKDYLKNPSGIEDVFKIFDNTYFLYSSNIRKYYEPIFEDKSIEFIAYFDTRFTHGWSSDDIKFNYNSKLGGASYEHKQPLENDKRKAKSIANSLRGGDCIDIHTGEILSDTGKFAVTLKYKDIGGILLNKLEKEDSHRSYTQCYTWLDDIYVSATKEEENELLDRIKMLAVLESTR